ncbi:hypothetical protein DFH09DRAFT_1261028 [Mycena vulgaris]|nr:hypothetical protein DFH09DRAFT_1261028 [Mycena vulgaris]
MYQVASYPQSPAFSAPSHREHHRERDSRPRYRDDAPTPGTLSLPRTLARPPFTDIARDALLAAAPDLSNVPAEFIRHGLRAKAPQMLAGITALAPSHLPTSIPRSHLPAALNVPLRASPGAAPVSYPTHALAIAPVAKGKSGERDVAHTIFPVHAVVLAAHCAKLPRLPPSAPSGRTASATLPVLPLTLPSPHAFAIIHTFMYTHRLAPALTALLPLPPAFLASASSRGRSGEELTHATLLATLASPPALHALASHLCASASSNLSTLMGHAGHVKELWQDMVALGMYDPELWDALDLAWEVVLGALNLAAQ